jgi:hypothetical protein
MMFLSFRGFQIGNVKKLTAPIDGDLRFCGINETKGYDHLYFAKLDEADLSKIF